MAAKTRSRDQAWLLTFCGFAVLACLDTGLDEDSDGENFLKLRAKTICDMNARCCPQEIHEARITTLRECYEERPKQLEQALADGEMTVDLRQARLCYKKTSQ